MVLNLAHMTTSKCLALACLMHAWCLATIATAATTASRQTEDLLREQDGNALRGDVSSHSRGVLGFHGSIYGPESQDAQTQLEISSISLRKPLHADQLAHDIYAYQLSRDVLVARWRESWHEDLPCSKPRNNGLVPKMGTASQSISMTPGEKREIYIGQELPVYAGCIVRSFTGFIYRCEKPGPL